MTTNSPEIAERLRELARFAEAGGAPEPMLHDVIVVLLELLADDIAARRLEAVQARASLRAFVDRWHGKGTPQGVVIAAACRRFRVSRSTIYARLSEDRRTSSALPSGQR
jgi:hypothetical protein